MPKMKTHSGLAKRVKKTGSGKVVATHANKGHLLSAKSKNSKRRHKGELSVSSTDLKRIKQQITYMK